MAEERENILRVDVDIETAGKELTSLVKELKKVQEQQKQFNKQLKEGNELSEDQQKQYAENVKRIDQFKKSQKEATNEIITGIKNQRGSLNSLRKDLKRLVDQRNKISLDTSEGRKAVKELNEEINDLNDSIKEIEEGGGAFQRSVGNYARAFEGVNPLIGKAIVALEGFNITALATRAALLSIPFVAILAILTTFIAKLSESEKFTQLLGRAFAVLKDVAQPAIDVLNAGLNTTVELFESAVDFIDSFINKNKEAETTFAGLEKRRAALINQEREFLVETRRLVKEEEALKNIRDDDRKSIQERIKANEELAAIETERLEKGISLQEERIALIEAEIEKQGGEALAGTEKLNELTEARVGLEELVEESIGRQNEAIVNQVALGQELFDIENEIATKRAEVAELEAETDKELFEAKKALLETQLQQEEEAVKRRGLNKQQENELLLLLENEYLQRQKDLREEFANEQIETIEANFEKESEISQKFLDEENRKAQNAIQEKLSLEKKAAKVKADIKKTEAETEEALARGTLDLAKTFIGESNALDVALGLADIGIELGKQLTLNQTASALTAATIPPPVGEALAAAQLASRNSQSYATAGIATAQILANQIAAAAGGGEFITKGPQLLLVGDNPGGQERVSVTPIGGRGTTTAGSNLAPINNNLQSDVTREQTQAIKNALSAMPPPVLVVKDYQKAERRVTVKETTTRL